MSPASAIGLAATLGLIAVTLVLASRGAFGPVPAPEPLAQIIQPRILPDDRPARIVVLGTSLSHGRAWPRELADRLSPCQPNGVTASVVARPGANSEWGLAAVGAVLAQAPDLVMVEFAINDASLARGLSLARSRAIHTALIAALREGGARVALTIMSGAHGRKRLERPGLAAYEAMYRVLARDAGTILVDLAPAWGSLDSPAAASAMPDGLHPDDAAVRRVALPSMTAALRPVLCGGPAGAAGQ